MPDLNAARARWGFLRVLHPLFLCAESLPRVEDADQDHDGTGAFDDSAVDRVDHLKNEITTLRNDLKLNVIKQQLVDTDQLTEDDAIVEGLEPELHSLLVQLEDLIDPMALGLEESQVNLPFCSRGASYSVFCFRIRGTTALSRRGTVNRVARALWHSCRCSFPSGHRAILNDTMMNRAKGH